MVCKSDFFSSHSIFLQKGDVDVFFHREADELKVPLLLKLRACGMNRTLVVCKLFNGHCSFVHFLCLSHSEHLLSSCLAFTVRVACASMMLNVQRFHSWFTFFPVCPSWLKEIKVLQMKHFNVTLFLFLSLLCAVCLCVPCNCCPLLLYLFMYR